MSDNLTWFYNYQQLLEEDYASEYIAIKDKQVIDHSPCPRRLIRRLKKHYMNTSNFTIEFVPSTSQTLSP